MQKIINTVILLTAILFYCGFAIYGHAIFNLEDASNDKKCMRMNKSSYNIVKVANVIGCVLLIGFAIMAFIQRNNIKRGMLIGLSIFWLFSFVSLLIGLGRIGKFEEQDDDENYRCKDKLSKSTLGFMKFAYYWNMIVLTFMLIYLTNISDDVNLSDVKTYTSDLKRRSFDSTKRKPLTAFD